MDLHPLWIVCDFNFNFSHLWIIWSDFSFQTGSLKMFTFTPGIREGVELPKTYQNHMDYEYGKDSFPQRKIEGSFQKNWEWIVGRPKCHFLLYCQ